MKRTVNHTGKRRIERKYFIAKPVMHGVQKEIELSWNLTGSGFSSADELIVEVDFLGSSIRSVLGTVGTEVGSTLIPFSNDVSQLNAKLTLLTVDARTDLRRITGQSAPLPIIFEKTTQTKQGLLRVQLIDDLRTLWSLDYSTGSPILQIANMNASYSKLSSRKVFLHSVLPEVVREICFTALIDSGSIDPEPRNQWIKLLKPYGLDDKRLNDFEAWPEDDIETKFMEALHMAKSVGEEFSARNQLVAGAVKELEAQND